MRANQPVQSTICAARQNFVRCNKELWNLTPARAALRSQEDQTELILMYIKTILAAATLVAVAASSPALAKTTHKTTHKATHHHVSRNEVRPVDAYAAASQNVRTTRPNHGSNNDVYDVRGRYIGSDPDATIRNQLARDPSQGD
jgi:hypothetical protein